MLNIENDQPFLGPLVTRNWNHISELPMAEWLLQAYPSTWFAATLYDGTVRLGAQRLCGSLWICAQFHCPLTVPSTANLF